MRSIFVFMFWIGSLILSLLNLIEAGIFFLITFGMMLYIWDFALNKEEEGLVE